MRGTDEEVISRPMKFYKFKRYVIPSMKHFIDLSPIFRKDGDLSFLVKESLSIYDQKWGYLYHDLVDEIGLVLGEQDQ